MSDIYSAPNASLMQSGAIDGYGSVEKALAGEYDFSVGNILSEAWAKTNGSKWTFQVAFAIYLGVLILVFGTFAMLGLMFGIGDDTASWVVDVAMQLVSQIAYMAIATPIYTGIMILGLRRATGASIRAGQILNHFDRIVPLLITALVTGIFTVIGYLALLLPGIYLAVSYVFAPMLVVEKGLSPGVAMSTSRKAIGKKWFAMFGLMMALFLLNMLALIPLTLGLIWTIPMSVIALGIAYRNMFGCEKATISEQ
jgi:uncharacterized membrane protein